MGKSLVSCKSLKPIHRSQASRRSMVRSLVLWEWMSHQLEFPENDIDKLTDCLRKNPCGAIQKTQNCSNLSDKCGQNYMLN